MQGLQNLGGGKEGREEIKIEIAIANLDSLSKDMANINK